MFYYIDLPRTLSLPIGLVKTESGFIVRSVGWFWWKKPKQGYGKKHFPTINFLTISFFTLRLNLLGLGNCSVPNFCKTGCSLVPRMNLSHTQQSYVCPKNQNYLLNKANLRFFLSYGLRTTKKSQYSVLFMLWITFQVAIVEICAKKYRLFKKTFYLSKNDIS